MEDHAKPIARTAPDHTILHTILCMRYPSHALLQRTINIVNWLSMLKENVKFFV